MNRKPGVRAAWLLGALAALCPLAARAAEHVTLTNGFELDCLRHEPVAGTAFVRLYPIAASGSSYLEVPAASIRTFEPLPDPPAPKPAPTPVVAVPSSNLDTMLSTAGARHHIDADLLAAVVKAESGGHALAVSRAGAQGLMQLMPGTARTLGVKDSFAPDQNINGGTAYLDQLLTRYHDDVALALAAYNAGPGAVDKYHGVPPFRETRAYVTRILNEFNRRKRIEMATLGMHTK